MDLPSAIVCTGPIPNQQVIPAVNWCFEKLNARRFFLAGTVMDTVSQVSNAMIKDQLKAMGATCVGEKNVALDGTGMPELVAAIKMAGPDIVLSTVSWRSEQALLRADGPGGPGFGENASPFVHDRRGRAS